MQIHINAVVLLLFNNSHVLMSRTPFKLESVVSFVDKLTARLLLFCPRWLKLAVCAKCSILATTGYIFITLILLWQYGNWSGCR